MAKKKAPPPKKINIKQIAKSVGRTVKNAVKDPKGTVKTIGKSIGKLAKNIYSKTIEKVVKKIVDLCPIQLLDLNAKKKRLLVTESILAKEKSKLTKMKDGLQYEKDRLTGILDKLKSQHTSYNNNIFEMNQKITTTPFIQNTEGFLEGKKNIKRSPNRVNKGNNKSNKSNTGKKGTAGKAMTISQCRTRRTALNGNIDKLNNDIRQMNIDIPNLKNTIIPNLYRNITNLKTDIFEKENQNAILKDQLYGNKEKGQLGYTDIYLRKVGGTNEIPYQEDYSNIYETNISNTIVEGMGTELQTLIKQNITIEKEINTNRQKHSVDNSSVFYQTKQYNTQQLYSLIFTWIFYICLLCLALFLFFIEDTISKTNKIILLTVLSLYPFYILYVEFAIYYVLYFFYTYSFGIPFNLSYRNVVDFWITIIQVVAV